VTIYTAINAVLWCDHRQPCSTPCHVKCPGCGATREIDDDEGDRLDFAEYCPECAGEEEVSA